jgi:predicted transcriptional regulator YheO
MKALSLIEKIHSALFGKPKKGEVVFHKFADKKATVVDIHNDGVTLQHHDGSKQRYGWENFRRNFDRPWD